MIRLLILFLCHNFTLASITRCPGKSPWYNNRNSDGISQTPTMTFPSYLRIYHIDAWFDWHALNFNILNQIVFYLHDPTVNFVKADEWRLDLARDRGDGTKVEMPIPSGRTVVGWK